jgi:hypothetical protein
MGKKGLETKINRMQKRARKTRKKLKKAALDVFTEKSVDAAAVEEFTEKADMGIVYARLVGITRPC